MILKPEFGVKRRNCRHRKCKPNEIKKDLFAVCKMRS